MMTYGDGSIGAERKRFLNLNVPEGQPIFIPAHQKQKVEVFHTINPVNEQQRKWIDDNPYAAIAGLQPGITGFVVYVPNQRRQIMLPVPILAKNQQKALARQLDEIRQEDFRKGKLK